MEEVNCENVNCSLCDAEESVAEARHLALYVMGSEGIVTCFHCRLALTAFAQYLRSIATRVRHAEYVRQLQRDAIKETSNNEG